MNTNSTTESIVQKQISASEKAESELKQFEKLLNEFFAATGI